MAEEKKRLIVCCDGTANDPDQMDRDRIAPTNVVKLTRALKHKTSTKDQFIYYDQGVGTGWWAKKAIEGFSGAGISQNIKEAYYFLAKNYEPGDEIYCFGFSRGAYTVRSLCGMIHVCGLLKSKYATEKALNETYKRYGTFREGAQDISHNCKIVGYNEESDYHLDAKIKFIGVWDTVGALGFPALGINFEWNKHHKVNEFKETVQYAYHALAIDEHRKAFRADMMSSEDVGIKLEQKWFAGSHSNVGGGYVDAGLSDISLEAMIRYISTQEIDGKENPFKLEFDEELIKNNNFINGNAFGELRNSRTSFYKIIPAFYRKDKLGRLGKTTFNKYIPEDLLDKSVIERILDPTSGYAPSNINTRKIKGEKEEIHQKEKGGQSKLEKDTYSIPDEYKLSETIKMMDEKYYKKPEDLKPDKFPIYLTNGSVVGLLGWFIAFLFWVFYLFDISIDNVLNTTNGIISFLLNVVVIPSLVLIGIVAFALLGFTAVSYFSKVIGNKK